MPELWIVNLTPELAIPAPGGLFLEPIEDRSAWRSLPVEGAEPIVEHAGLPVFAQGRARSRAVPGGELDVGALLAFLRGADR